MVHCVVGAVAVARRVLVGGVAHGRLGLGKTRQTTELAQF